MSCTTISPFMDVKQELFAILFSNHVNLSIYKSDNITYITRFIGN